MPWGSIVGAGLGLLSSKGDSGASQTASKEPWAEAAPWLKSIIGQGQALQSQYTAQPFSASQQNAYGNLAGQTAYVQQLIPGLLGQVSGQGYYDRSNPNARPQAYNFNAGQAAPVRGLLQSPSTNPTAGQMQPYQAPAQAAAPAFSLDSLSNEQLQDLAARMAQARLQTNDSGG